MMVDDILQLAHNQQFLERITSGKPSILPGYDLIKKLPNYEDLQDYQAQLQRKGQLTFEAVFSDPVGQYLLQTFLVAEHNVDKAVFLQDVRLYKKLNDPTARQRVAEKIFEHFLSKEGRDHVDGVSVFHKSTADIPWFAHRKLFHEKLEEIEAMVGPEKPLIKMDYGNPRRGFTPRKTSNLSKSNSKRGTRRTSSPRKKGGKGKSSKQGSESPSKSRKSRSQSRSHRTIQITDPKVPETAEEMHAAAVRSQWPSLRADYSNAIGVYGTIVEECYHQIFVLMHCPINLFENIERSILIDLTNDVFPRFKLSSQFCRYIQCRKLQEKNVTIKEFITLRPLGRGAFGVVYACEKKGCGKLYAMKQLNKRRVQGTNSAAAIHQERNYLALSDSNFVTGLKYATQDDTTLYLIIDLMLGGDLKYHLNIEERFPEERSRFLCAEILLGIEHLHSKGIVYRDLKLENVLMDEFGHVKISDLGLAVKLTPESQRKGAPAVTRGYAGTPGYTAPEVVLGFAYDIVADYFSYGVLIYRCLCGRKPYEKRKDRRKVMKKKTSQMDRNVIEMEPEYLNQFISPNARSLVKGLLVKDPKLRLGHAGVHAVKQHPWFDKIDFGLLEAGYLEPPTAPKLDEVHGPVNSNDAPPQDEQYNEVKLTEEFEKSLEGFDYVSATAVQMEMVELLRDRDAKQSAFREGLSAWEGNGYAHNSCLTRCALM